MPKAVKPPATETANKFSTQAMEHIQNFHLPATPEIYTLWYAYIAGTEPGLKHKIDRALQNGEAITIEACDNLYREFFTEDGERDVVRETGRKMQKIIKEISTVLERAGGASADYSHALAKHTSSMEDVSSLNELKTMVNFLIEDTRLMINKNQELETQLNWSTAEITVVRADLEKVQQEALTDGLTGLPNRRYFENIMREQAARILEGDGETLSLIMVDIDHFKVFNDTYGHQIGDQVLRLVAHFLKQGIRGRDVACRYGGEEFAVILPNTNISGAVTVAENLREAIAAKDIINQTRGESLGRLSVSAGISQFEPGETIAGFVNRADRALYRAKDMGRNRVIKITYDPQLEPNSEDDSSIVVKGE